MSVKGYGITGKVDYLFSNKIEELENGKWQTECGQRVIGTYMECVTAIVKVDIDRARAFADEQIDPFFQGTIKSQADVRAVLAQL